MESDHPTRDDRLVGRRTYDGALEFGSLWNDLVFGEVCECTALNGIDCLRGDLCGQSPEVGSFAQGKGFSLSERSADATHGRDSGDGDREALALILQ